MYLLECDAPKAIANIENSLKHVLQDEKLTDFLLVDVKSTLCGSVLEIEPIRTNSR
jgi:hypothetical protein